MVLNGGDWSVVFKFIGEFSICLNLKFSAKVGSNYDLVYEGDTLAPCSLTEKTKLRI